MAWPERAEDSASSSWYLKCQAIAERRFTARKTDGFWWYIWFLTRAAIFGYVLYYVAWFMTRKIPRILGFGPLRRDPNFKKLRRVVQLHPLFWSFFINFCHIWFPKAWIICFQFSNDCKSLSIIIMGILAIYRAVLVSWISVALLVFYIYARA